MVVLPVAEHIQPVSEHKKLINDNHSSDDRVRYMYCYLLTDVLVERQRLFAVYRESLLTCNISLPLSSKRYYITQTINLENDKRDSAANDRS